jgi:hypothetical protein
MALNAKRLCIFGPTHNRHIEGLRKVGLALRSLETCLEIQVVDFCYSNFNRVYYRIGDLERETQMTSRNSSRASEGVSLPNTQIRHRPRGSGASNENTDRQYAYLAMVVALLSEHLSFVLQLTLLDSF